MAQALATATKPYDPMPGEPMRAFDAFRAYLELGPSRSNGKAAVRVGKTTDLLDRWAARWNWVDRARARDADAALMERHAQEEVARAAAIDWNARRISIRRMEYDAAEQLAAVARKALDRFMAGDAEPPSLAEVARALELASKLGRLASGMATDKTELTGEDGGPIRIALSAALDRVYGTDTTTGPVTDAELVTDAVADAGQASDTGNVTP